MLDIYTELKKIIQKFNAAKIDYAICGGIAVVFHGFVRATEDIDILILAEDLNKAEEVVSELGFIIKAGLMNFSGRKIQRISKFEGRDYLILDLLLVNEQMKDIWDFKINIIWENTKVKIVSKKDLIKLKQHAGRAKDLIDIEELKKLDDE